MIRSWRNSVTRKVWEGERPNQLGGLDFDAAIDLLLALNVAKAFERSESTQERWPAQAERRPQKSVGNDRECSLAHLLRVPQR
jgi:hypothetical protein